MNRSVSKWHRISEMIANPADLCKVGVYQVRATKEDHTPVPIHRACCDDPDGILYIGRGFLPDRIGRLMRIHEPNPKPHHNFIPVFFAYGLERICDRKFIEVRWMECPDFALEEGRLLQEYKKRTGDMPPGNLKLEPFAAPVVVPDPTTDLEQT